MADETDPQEATTTNREETEAIAVFIKDTIYINDFEVTAGIRGEFIDGFYQNEAPGKEGEYLKKETSIWLPSLSVFYKYSDNLGFFAGVHEGFIPTSPAERPDVEIENSINYEVGGRYHNQGTNVEVVAFFNDVENLKESCSFSAAGGAGCNLDQEFNGGESSVLGLEFTANHTFNTDVGLDVPVSATYTYTKGEFDTSFVSDFPMWGSVEKGDKLPYLPENQLTLSVGIASDLWEINLIARYIDEMDEVSGSSITPEGDVLEDLVLEGATTKSLTVLDLSASYDLNEWGSLYFKLDNVLDDQEIVSRRPYGARPSKPQQAVIGYQYSF